MQTVPAPQMSTAPHVQAATVVQPHTPPTTQQAQQQLAIPVQHVTLQQPSHVMITQVADDDEDQKRPNTTSRRRRRVKSKPPSTRLINILHSDYIWLDYTGTNCGAKTLIDREAQVSLMLKYVYDGLPTEKKLPLRPSPLHVLSMSCRDSALIVEVQRYCKVQQNVNSENSSQAHKQVTFKRTNSPISKTSNDARLDSKKCQDRNPRRLQAP